MAVQLIDSLQTVHSTGRTFNDIKPDNVMVSGSKLTLIDFGLCDRFITESGKHHSSSEEVQDFKGNLIFASARQLKFLKSSRKDDLLSLGYMLVYLLND